jgi:MFS family permease
MLGYVILYFFRGTALVFIGSLLMMCGYLAGAAVFGAVIRDNTPENRAGMFQGLRIVGQVLLPGIIGPALGAKILENAEKIINDDGTESFVPNRNIFLAALAVAALLCVILFISFKATEKKENK